MGEKNPENKENPNKTEVSPKKGVDPAVAKKLGETAIKGDGKK